MSRITDGLYVVGDIEASGSIVLPAGSITNSSVSASAAIARSKLALDGLKPFVINPTDWRVWDAIQTVLPGTSASDDLGLYGGTFATSSPLIRTYDVKTLTTTLYARAQIILPAEYEAGGTVTIRLKSGMVTTVASSAATIDIQAYKVDGAGGIGSDICATSAQSINSLSFANKDFSITAASLNPGDVLDVRVAIAVTDAATGTAVIGAFGLAQLLCDIRG